MIRPPRPPPSLKSQEKKKDREKQLFALRAIAKQEALRRQALEVASAAVAAQRAAYTQELSRQELHLNCLDAKIQSVSDMIASSIQQAL